MINLGVTVVLVEVLILTIRPVASTLLYLVLDVFELLVNRLILIAIVSPVALFPLTRESSGDHRLGPFVSMFDLDVFYLVFGLNIF